MDLKSKQVSIFENTNQLCTDNEVLSKAIKKTIENTKLFKKKSGEIVRKYKNKCKLVVSKKRSFEAAEYYKKNYSNEKVAVLNFASATNPGGGVKNGSTAQEECLCRCSTLYFCLNTNYLRKEFYNFHKKQHNLLYSDLCIYTPDIIVFKSDTNLPYTKTMDKWFSVDVLSCAAPNLRNQSISVSEEELYELLKDRIEHILQVALNNDIDTIILGAFGCGAFKNPPKIVASAFKDSIKKYQYSFKTVEFAIYCKGTDTENFDVFKKVFNDF